MAAFQTSSFFQAGILKDLGYHDLGFISLGLIYGLFAVSNFIAPYIIYRFGARTCMMIGGSFYCAMLASLIYILKPVFLAASCLNGIGAALLWTGEGAAMSSCSTAETQGRNAGIFWGILQLSLIAGSMTANFIIPNQDTVSRSTESNLYITLTSICAAGVLGMLFLKLPSSEEKLKQSSNQKYTDSPSSPHHHLHNTPPTVAKCVRGTLSMFQESIMLLLLPSIFFSGLLLSFWQAQYPNVIANKNKAVPLPKEFKPHEVAYLMLTICAAEVSGSVLFGRLSDRIGRWPILIAGATFACIAWLLIYLNMFKQIWTPTLGAGYAYGFLLGLADSIYNTQTFAALGVLFPRRVPDAFAANFFAKALASAVAFYYNPYVPLSYQMLGLGILSVISTVAFVTAEVRVQRRRGSDCEPLLVSS
eukprot:gene6936-9567_t